MARADDAALGSADSTCDSSSAPEPAEPDARARAAALLEATHQFPCAYFLTVIALHDEQITRRLVEAVKRIDDESHRPYSSQPSSGGKYVSHRFSVRVSGAGDVLELYEVVRTVEGVVTVM